MFVLRLFVALVILLLVISHQVHRFGAISRMSCISLRTISVGRMSDLTVRISRPQHRSIGEGGSASHFLLRAAYVYSDRACLMTGRYPFRYGLQTAVIPSAHTYGLLRMNGCCLKLFRKLDTRLRSSASGIWATRRQKILASSARLRSSVWSIDWRDRLLYPRATSCARLVFQQ